MRFTGGIMNEVLTTSEGRHSVTNPFFGHRSLLPNQPPHQIKFFPNIGKEPVIFIYGCDFIHPLSIVSGCRQRTVFQELRQLLAFQRICFIQVNNQLLAAIQVNLQ